MTDTFRQKYRELSEMEAAWIGSIKHEATTILNDIQAAENHGGDRRCLAVARTKLEEAVMWAVKGVTA